MANPGRSGVGTWILIGLAVVLVLGTAGAVSIRFARCPECHTTVGPDRTVNRMVRVEGRWTRSDDRPCGCCGSVGRRGRVTLLSYVLSQARHQR